MRLGQQYFFKKKKFFLVEFNIMIGIENSGLGGLFSVGGFFPFFVSLPPSLSFCIHLFYYPQDHCDLLVYPNMLYKTL